MLQNKTSIVRSHLLNLLETGKLRSGDQIPGARDLAALLGISFVKVQQAVETLCKDGVLESMSRKGVFVQKAWSERILPENMRVYNQLHRLPWMSGLVEIAQNDFPGLRMTWAFQQGMLELRTTSHVLMDHHEYMDLSDIFDRCYPDHSVFFERPFQPFRVNGKVMGIPFAFSPRVIFYNPRLFKEAGCEEPRAGWTWDQFITTIKQLRTILPADRVIDWHAYSFLWMNFILRAGGRLFTPGAPDPVTLDSPRTLEGLRLFSELGDLLGRPYFDDDSFRAGFLSGQVAMRIHGRNLMDNIMREGFTDWATVPMPVFPGGEDATAQATDLICVRKSCTSEELATRYISMMLSEQVQDYIGGQKYSIPIRKSSAFKSLDLSDPRDSLFAVEMGKASTAYNYGPPFPGYLTVKGIETLLAQNLDLETGLKELAQMARTYLGIHGYPPASDEARSVFSVPRARAEKAERALRAG
jgi:ABC-type glycerol-3-phosphate transport system substrate-binding protein